MSSYILPASIAERFQRFTSEQPDSSMTSELALIRSMLEVAIERNQSALAVQLLGVLTKTVNTADLCARRNSEYIHVSELGKIATQVISAVISNFNDIDGWELRVERCAETIASTLEAHHES